MFANPKHSVGALNLREGMIVADLGAGSGSYSFASSIHVGHTGRVYAVEVQKNLVKKLESEIKNKGINNIDVIWGDIERLGGTKIRDHSMDRVIVSNVLSQAENKLGLIDEVKRILKDDGLVLVIDLTGDHFNNERIKHHIIPKDKAEELFIKRGFQRVQTISTEPYHYGIILKA